MQMPKSWNMSTSACNPVDTSPLAHTTDSRHAAFMPMLERSSDARQRKHSYVEKLDDMAKRNRSRANPHTGCSPILQSPGDPQQGTRTPIEKVMKGLHFLI
ncbi:hypothetical protein PTI98_005792 [Pleurotus ostreatus]|nr:hypothetical protein PTI98_005792 [Pleurotus ostreatus]